MSESLEEKLEALRGPQMPADVERRLRGRLRVHARRSPRRRRVSFLWVALLLLLAIGAALLDTVPYHRHSQQQQAQDHCVHVPVPPLSAAKTR